MKDFWKKLTSSEGIKDALLSAGAALLIFVGNRINNSQAEKKLDAKIKNEVNEQVTHALSTMAESAADKAAE